MYTRVQYTVLYLYDWAVHSVNADVHLFLCHAHYIIIKYIMGSYIPYEPWPDGI